MPLWNTYSNTPSNQPPAGTLASNNLFYKPPVPKTSEAGGGVQGSDDRAYTGNIQDGELVENRLNNLLEDESAYMRNARLRGIQGASRRGLGNSSIAAGASQRAAIESGLPIAQADAQTSLASRFKNQDALNENLMQERDIANRMLQNQRDIEAQMGGYQTQLEIAAMGERGSLQRQRENLAFEGEQQGLSRQQQEMMSRLGADLSDRNTSRDWLRTMARDENTFSNERYDALMAYDLRELASNSDFLRTLLQEDPSFDPNALSGVYDFMDSIGQRYVVDLFDRYGLGG